MCSLDARIISMIVIEPTSMTLNDILQMFGNDVARNKFSELCAQYFSESVRQEAAEQMSEPPRNSVLADIHNQIM